MNPTTKVKPLERREPVSAESKRLLVEVLVRNPKAFAAINGLLAPQDFAPDAEPAGLMYAAAKRFYDKHGELPARHILAAELNQLMAVDPDVFPPEVIKQINDMMKHAWGPDAEDFVRPASVDYALGIARRFAEEVALRKLAIEGEPGRMLPSDLPKYVRDTLEQVERAASVGAATADHRLFHDGWDDEPSVVRQTTGSDLLDYFTGGGDAAGWVTAVMAPYGSCKTTLGVHSTVVAAVQARAQYESQRRQGKRPVVFYFSAETPLSELRRRTLAAGAMVPLEDLMDRRPLENLSDDITPSTLEQMFFRDQIKAGSYTSRRRRAADTIETINSHAQFVDFTGADPKNRSLGLEGPADIARYLADYTRRFPEVEVRGVWVDHASAVVNRMVRARGLDNGQRTQLLGGLPLELRDLVGAPFNTPVRVFQQLSGAANAFGPAASLSHTDSAGCKSFAEYCDFAVLIGMPSGEDRVAKSECSKFRHRPPQPVRFLRIYGGVGRVVDVTDEYMISPSGRSIVCKSEVRDAGIAAPPVDSYQPGSY